MIRVIIGTAPESVFEDGQHWDTWETVMARTELRTRIAAWNASELASRYPPIQLYRDLKDHIKPMVAWMDFETEEEAALFKLTHADL